MNQQNNQEGIFDKLSRLQKWWDDRLPIPFWVYVAIILLIAIARPITTISGIWNDPPASCYDNEY